MSSYFPKLRLNVISSFDCLHGLLNGPSNPLYLDIRAVFVVVMKGLDQSREDYDLVSKPMARSKDNMLEPRPP